MKITSAYANKLLKSLTDEKSYWEAKEAASRTYVAAVGEEPVIPEYDYTDVSATLKEIDRKTVIIKHALNLANAFFPACSMAAAHPETLRFAM